MQYRMAAVAILAVGFVALKPSTSPAVEPAKSPSCGFMNHDEGSKVPQPHSYVGMWVTPNGQIRHELLPNGRYDEARGSRESAYRGRYQITGNTIVYWDDTGFTADGVFVAPNVLHHGGMIFHRKECKP
jgi:Agrobacterium tumefaciens protein Atu4866